MHMTAVSRMLIGSLAVAFLSTACGTASQKSNPSVRAQPSATSGKAEVVYAGSLENVNELTIGPAFKRSSGFQYQGRGGGAFGMAQEIKSRTIPANVFESLGYAPIEVIEPTFTTWAISFAASPLVVAYSPKSRFAPELNAIRAGQKPLSDLFTLMAQTGFHLGRTNPNTDPQGQAFYWMVELAVKKYHLSPSLVSKILGPVDNPHQVYSEEGILTFLQSGGLDAASAYLPEALERHLDYISLPNDLNFSEPSESSWYQTASVTLNQGKVVHGAPLSIDITTVGTPNAAAVAFIHFLLGAKGQSLMKKAGFPTFTPTVLGTAKAVPKGIIASNSSGG